MHPDDDLKRSRRLIFNERSRVGPRSDGRRQMLELLRSWLRAGGFGGGVILGTDAGPPQRYRAATVLAVVTALVSPLAGYLPPYGG